MPASLVYVHAVISSIAVITVLLYIAFSTALRTGVKGRSHYVLKRTCPYMSVAIELNESNDPVHSTHKRACPCVVWTALNITVISDKTRVKIRTHLTPDDAVRCIAVLCGAARHYRNAPHSMNHRRSRKGDARTRQRNSSTCRTSFSFLHSNSK